MASACALAIFSGKIINIRKNEPSCGNPHDGSLFYAIDLCAQPHRHHSTMMLLPVISAGTGRPI